jgi:hypothetical protein
LEAALTAASYTVTSKPRQIPRIRRFPTTVHIMDSLYATNVSTDGDFQTKYKAFYRVRQKTDASYQSYFKLLEKNKRTRPAYNSKTKHADAVTAYASIVCWYRGFMKSAGGVRWVRLFNESVSDYYRITDIKKVDFILWQTRA